MYALPFSPHAPGSGNGEARPKPKEPIRIKNKTIRTKMKIRKAVCMLTLSALLASGCTSYEKVPYLQNAQAIEVAAGEIPLYDAKIMPKDLLTITVSTTDPQASIPFNLTVQSAVSQATTSLTTQPVLQQYLVDNQGEIDFPVLGRLKISGLTKNECEALIREKLIPYLKETPIVNVRMVNYKISVLGEVKSPGTFTVSNEKVNVLEALAMAGDMTVYGVRDNVKLVRENANGERLIQTLNLNDADLIRSPYFYLQQNDILYVSPNKTAARNSDIGNSTTLWISATSILVSIASLLVTILK